MDEYGSSVASLALILWVPLAVVLFFLHKPRHGALLITLLGALYLPEEESFVIPVFPDIEKRTLTPLIVLPLLLFAGRGAMRDLKFGSTVKWLFFGVLVENVIRVVLNRDPVVTGIGMLPALVLQNALTFTLEDFLRIWGPMCVGFLCLVEKGGDARFLKTYVHCGLVYLILVLVEIRLSPQLHYWVYDYAQHSFHQSIRGGGYRPMVFMAHGLAVAMFMATCTVLAFLAFRQRLRIFGFSALFWAIVLMVVLVMSRSLGATALAMAAVTLLLMVPSAMQMRFAFLIALLVLLYPAARAQALLPIDQILELASQFNAERGASLAYRINQEVGLLENTMRRPWFGWGGFARFHIVDELGQSISTTDGHWIIVMGQRGLVGFGLYFGLLTWPIIKAWGSLSRVRKKRDKAFLAGLALTTAIYILDLLPNGMLADLPFLFGGALLGKLRRLELDRREVAVGLG